MRPREAAEWSLQFGSHISPWWLVLLIPLGALACYQLYRNQFKGLAWSSVTGLVLLRMVLVGGVLALAFRPSLVHRRTTTYPGRIVFLVDDSESMAAKDNRLSDEEALRLSRGLRPLSADQAEAYHALAETLFAVEARVRKFEAFARTADRSQEAFWDEAERAQRELGELLSSFDRRAASAPGLGPDEKKQFDAVVADVHSRAQATKVFFSGDRSPEKKVYDRFYREIENVRGRLLELQASLDRLALRKGNKPLETAADAVRARSRIELVGEKLANVRPKLSELAPGQGLQCVRLMSGKIENMESFAPADLRPVAGTTDIVGRIEALLEEKSDFPISAIVLVSDGRDLGGRSLTALEQELSRKQIPVCVGAVGSRREPFDLAVLRLIAPPFAVRGSPVNVKVRLKAALPKPSTIEASVLRGAQIVASTRAEVGAEEEESIVATFTPAETGLFRYSLRLQTMPGEAFPVQNNAMDFAINVRNEGVKVLFLDWKPRWESRFALNILGRLDYIEVNPVIVLSQEGAALKRGVRKGTWPESLSALEMYDLVVIGDIPPETLSSDEWGNLLKLVEDRGKTVCFIGTGSRSPVPVGKGLENLLPLAPSWPTKNGPAPEPLSVERPADLSLTEAGELHPVTRLLARGIGTAAGEASGRVLRDTQVLLAAREDARPLVSCRFVGKGKTLLIDTDTLWKALNPTLLSEHGSMYVGLVTWAVEGGTGQTDTRSGRQTLAIDARSFVAGGERMPAAQPSDGGDAGGGGGRESPAPGQRTRRSGDGGIQVWVIGATAPVTVQAVADAKVLGKATAAPIRAGSSLARAEFTNLPPADIVFRIEEGVETVSDSVVVLQDYPELKHLARNEAFLTELAASTGGECRDFAEVEKSIPAIPLKERVEKHERSWRLWDSATILALLACVLTIEWVWRKLVGLV